MALDPGARLGRYEVSAPIGAGGIGEIYRARDTKLGRDVAVKVLRERHALSASQRARLEREARVLAALSHPNILTVYDVGAEQDMVFIVTELLDGETLRIRLRKAPLAIPTVRDFALQIARGLETAHAKGIVHRDLKPENIFLSAAGPLKILDFGLARIDETELASQAHTKTSFITTPGTVLGTKEYMAPEQLLGRKTDHRTDLFSFGLVLYEMLFGQRPFAADASDEIAGAGQRAGRSTVVGTDAETLASLERVALSCLETRPADRLQSTSDLRSALETQGIAPVRTGSRTAASRPATGDASIAVLPFVDMSPGKDLEYFCDGVAEEIINALTSVAGLRVVARSSAFQFKGKAQDVRTVGDTLQVRNVLEGSVRADGERLRIATQLIDTTDGYQVWGERFDREMGDVFAIQDEIAGAVVDSLQLRISEQAGPGPQGTRDLEAYDLFLKGRHHRDKRTEHDLQESLECFRAALERDPGYAQACAGLAEAYVTLGLYGAMAPNQAMPRAKAAADRAVSLGGASSAVLATLGCIDAVYAWSWSEAERAFASAIDLNPGHPAAHHWYGVNYLVPLGRFDEAAGALRRALEVDPLSPVISASFGVTSYFAGRYDDAVDELSSALELDADFPTTRYFLGLTLTEMGRYDEALAELEAATRLSGGSPEMTAAHAYTSARAGQTEPARATVAELTALADDRYVSPSLIAQVHTALDDAPAALDWLERGRDVRAVELAWLAVRPVFAGLRAEPRFRALLDTVGLLGS